MEHDILPAIVTFLSDTVNTANQYVWETPEALPWLVVALLASGFFVTVRLGFIQVRKVRHGIDVARGKFDDPNDKGDISHFQALSTALSATVGIGNIAGVAIAIHLGGPGALFWMWVTAVFGMALKYAECTLSMHYRVFDADGNAAGGPMYYIEKGLGRRWKPLAILFACCGVIASFGGGNMNQANTVADSARTDFGFNNVIVGFVLAVIVAAVILGGIKRIGRVSSKLAPLMALVYVVSALMILLLNAGAVPEAFSTIFRHAFNPAASLGGSVAGVLMTTLVWGVRRGLFSNEAGQGSAPIAHAAAKTGEPVREGVVAMLGPLIDTLIICTMTGLVIVVTGVWDQKYARSLDLGEVRVVPVAGLAANDGTEHSKIESALAVAKHLDEDDAPNIELEVVDGVQTAVAFVASESIIDDARLIDADTGKLYSGSLTYVRAEANLVRSDALALRVAGRGLLTGSPLTAKAFQKGLAPLGNWGNLIVTLCVFLFGLSTMISWSYYGDRCTEYLLGIKWVLPYRILYVVFVFIGSSLTLEFVWGYGDLALGLMTVPNLIAVVLLTPKLIEMTREYFTRYGD
ncbi:MAG: sodium:alanine symporter family protein [Myxococcota bacterium]